MKDPARRKVAHEVDLMVADFYEIRRLIERMGGGMLAEIAAVVDRRLGGKTKLGGQPCP